MSNNGDGKRVAKQLPVGSLASESTEVLNQRVASTSRGDQQQPPAVLSGFAGAVRNIFRKAKAIRLRTAVALHAPQTQSTSSTDWPQLRVPGTISALESGATKSSVSQNPHTTSSAQVNDQTQQPVEMRVLALTPDILQKAQASPLKAPNTPAKEVAPTSQEAKSNLELEKNIPSIPSNANLGTLAQRETREKAVVCYITFWKNGFTLGENLLMAYDDPEGEKILNAINKGTGLTSYFNCDKGQLIELRVF